MLAMSYGSLPGGLKETSRCFLARDDMSLHSLGKDLIGSAWRVRCTCTKRSTAPYLEHLLTQKNGEVVLH